MAKNEVQQYSGILDVYVNIVNPQALASLLVVEIAHYRLPGVHDSKGMQELDQESAKSHIIISSTLLF